MDGITEPVVLVLGHPIGGNPAQFALERAFDSLKLQWRVLSCDVSPERIEDAIAGAEVLGFRGLLLDRNLVIRPAESDASSEQTVTDESDDGGNPAAIDFFCRQPDRATSLTAQDLLSDWLGETLRSFLKQHEIDDAQCLEIGPKDISFPAAIMATRHHSPIAWAATESLQSANVIAMTTEVETDAWPEPASPTLVVDLSHRPNEIDQLRSLGYHVLGNEEIRIGILMECLQRWTGQVPPEEVLTEAIEEYLAV